MAMDNKRIVRVNVEVVYDDGTLEELTEWHGHSYQLENIGDSHKQGRRVLLEMRGTCPPGACRLYLRERR